MKYSEIENLTVEELRNKRREIKEELFESKMKNTLGQLTNPLSIRLKRRDIAKIETALSQKSSQASQ